MTQLMIGFSRSGRMVCVRPMHRQDHDDNVQYVGPIPQLYVSQPAVMAGKDHILALPIELLQMCFQPLIQQDLEAARALPFWGPDGPTYNRHVSALKLSLVCKRFMYAVRPMLFSDIVMLHWDHVGWFRSTKSDRHCRLLLRIRSFLCTMEYMPHLRNLLSHLTVDIDTFAPFARFEPQGLTDCLNLKKLILRAKYDQLDEQCWESCVLALCQLPNLRELEIWVMSKAGVRLGHISRFVALLKRLSRLTLNGVSCPDEPPRRTYRSILGGRPFRNPRAEDEMASMPPAGLEGTASFEELHLTQSHRISPIALKNFLLWPRILKSITMSSFAEGHESVDELIRMGILSYPWNWNWLRDVLSSHRHTIQTLGVGGMAARDGLRQFDLHYFTALRTLKICAVCATLSAEKAAELWLTPTLHRLVLDCYFDDPEFGKKYYFGLRELDWLTEFVQIASRRRFVGQDIALQEIEVTYNIHSYHYDGFDSENLDAHPYTLIPRCKAVVEETGFHFICPLLRAPRAERGKLYISSDSDEATSSEDEISSGSEAEDST